MFSQNEKEELAQIEMDLDHYKGTNSKNLETRERFHHYDQLVIMQVKIHKIVTYPNLRQSKKDKDYLHNLSLRIAKNKNEYRKYVLGLE